MRDRRMPFAGALALTSGAVGIAAALVSLAPSADLGMPMSPVMEGVVLPPLLLLVLSGIILLNGILLIVGAGLGPRPQGGLMLLYGSLMVLVGVLMAGTTLFAMEMALVSAFAMFGFGGLMVVSGVVMIAAKPMVGA